MDPRKITIFSILIVLASAQDAPQVQSLTILPPECQRFCPLNYDPVCVRIQGSFMEFGNACQLGVYNCENGLSLTGRRGPCPIRPCARDCPDVCPLVYDPVCVWIKGSYVEFGNACQLGVHNCQNCLRLVGKPGPCPQQTCISEGLT